MALKTTKKRVLRWLCKVSFVTKQKRNDMNVFQKEPKQNKQYYQKRQIIHDSIVEEEKKVYPTAFLTMTCVNTQAKVV